MVSESEPTPPAESTERIDYEVTPEERERVRQYFAENGPHAHPDTLGLFQQRSTWLAEGGGDGV